MRRFDKGGDMRGLVVASMQFHGEICDAYRMQFCPFSEAVEVAEFDIDHWAAEVDREVRYVSEVIGRHCLHRPSAKAGEVIRSLKAHLDKTVHADRTIYHLEEIVELLSDLSRAFVSLLMQYKQAVVDDDIDTIGMFRKDGGTADIFYTALEGLLPTLDAIPFVSERDAQLSRSVAISARSDEMLGLIDADVAMSEPAPAADVGAALGEGDPQPSAFSAVPVEMPVVPVVPAIPAIPSTPVDIEGTAPTLDDVAGDTSTPMATVDAVEADAVEGVSSLRASDLVASAQSDVEAPETPAPLEEVQDVLFGEILPREAVVAFDREADAGMLGGRRDALVARLLELDEIGAALTVAQLPVSGRVSEIVSVHSLRLVFAAPSLFGSDVSYLRNDGSMDDPDSFQAGDVAAEAALSASGMIVPALLGADAEAAQRLAASAVGNGLGEAVRALGDAAVRLSHMGIALVEGDLARVTDQAALRIDVDREHAVLLGELDRLSPASFKFVFQPHTEVIEAINRQGGFIAQLRAAIVRREASDPVIVDAIERIGAKNGPQKMLDQWCDAFTSAGTRIRRPILSTWETRLQLVHGALKRWTRAVEVLEGARQGVARSRRASEAMAGLPGILQDLDAKAGASTHPLSATLHRVVRMVRLHLEGTGADVPAERFIERRRLIELLSTTTVRIDRGLVPAGTASEVIEAFERFAQDRSVRLSSALPERVLSLAKSGRTTAAHRLAAVLSDDGTLTKALAEDLADAASIAEAEVGDGVMRVGRRFEQVERLTADEDGPRLSLLSERIRSVGASLPLPRPLHLAPIGEAEPGLDAQTLQSEIAAIGVDLDRLLEKPRSAALSRIDDLPASMQESKDRLRGLVERGDYVTALEYLDHAEGGGRLPRGEAANEAFRSFTEMLMADTVAAEPPGWSEAFSASTPADAAKAVLALVGVALSGPPVALRGTSDVMVRVALPPSRSRGFLLPDFGTRADDAGGLRTMMAATLPDQSVLERIAGAGSALVLLQESLSLENRERLATFTRVRGLRLLVIDAAIARFVAREEHASPLLAVELAQPFAFSDPFNDWKVDVPAEMFVGRDKEIAGVIDANGPTMLFGGRRLGKSAVLYRVERMLAEAESGLASADRNVFVVYIDIRAIGESDPINSIWNVIGHHIKPVLKGCGPIRQRKTFIGQVEAWLDANPGRRILVLLDEADAFVARDAAEKYPETTKLVSLMQSTGRRFKVVFAGNVNVTRAVSKGNSPLRPFTSDAIKIGPLTGPGDRAAAERLVTRPLAALGYEFESRDLIWSILSKGLYYPVLVSLITKGILGRMRARAKGDVTMPMMIGRDDVDAVLADPEVKASVAERFSYTLALGDMYEFFAILVALQPRGVPEALTAHALAAEASQVWPAAFPAASSLFQIEDIQSELDLLGVLRRVSGGGFDLRSDVIRDLLGSREQMEAKLRTIASRPPVAPTTDSDRRRVLKADGDRPETADGRLSPFTLAQERAIGDGRSHMLIVTGNRLLEVDLAVAAIAQQPLLRGRDRSVEVVSPPTVIDLVGRLVVLDRDKRQAVVVVTAQAPWTMDWLRHVQARPEMNSGKIRVVFVADKVHARAIFDETGKAPIEYPVVALGLMTRSMAESYAIDRDLAMSEGVMACLPATTGMYPSVVCEAFAAIGSLPDRAGGLAAWRDRLGLVRGFLADAGLDGRLERTLSSIAKVVDGEEISVDDLREVVFEGLDFDREIEPDLRYGESMGLLSRQGVGEGRLFQLSPFYLSACSQIDPRRG